MDMHAPYLYISIEHGGHVGHGQLDEELACFVSEPVCSISNKRLSMLASDLSM